MLSKTTQSLYLKVSMNAIGKTPNHIHTWA